MLEGTLMAAGDVGVGLRRRWNPLAVTAAGLAFAAGLATLLSVMLVPWWFATVPLLLGLAAVVVGVSAVVARRYRGRAGAALALAGVVLGVAVVAFLVLTGAALTLLLGFAFLLG